MKYEAVYKCRMCGNVRAVKDVLQTPLEKEAVRINRIMLNEGKIYTDEGYAPIVRQHFCDDGSIGLEDFQGMRKADE